MDGNTALGASSPAKPAFTRPEPLSHTSAVVSSSSHMVFGFCKDRKAAETNGGSSAEDAPPPTERPPSPGPRTAPSGAWRQERQGDPLLAVLPGSGLRRAWEWRRVLATPLRAPPPREPRAQRPGHDCAFASFRPPAAEPGPALALCAPRWPSPGEGPRYRLAGRAEGGRGPGRSSGAPPPQGRSGLFGTLNVPGSPRRPPPPVGELGEVALAVPWLWRSGERSPRGRTKNLSCTLARTKWQVEQPTGGQIGKRFQRQVVSCPLFKASVALGTWGWSSELVGPCPLSLPHARPTWAGGYTCCSLARAPVSAGGKRGFCCCCPLRWPPVLPLQFYIARGRPTRPRAARRNVAPLLEPYLDVGH